MRTLLPISTKWQPVRHFRWLLLLPLLVLAGCNGGRQASARRDDTEVAPYVPKPKQAFQEVQLASLQVARPQILEAEYVEDDELCLTCHEAYTKSHKHNVHRGQSCEKCHGPASRHLASRGKEPGSILSFKTLSAPERAELCLQCHEQNACTAGGQWRISKHAHHGVSCTDCHTQHYNVPPGTPATQLAANDVPNGHQLVSYIQEEEAPIDQATLREQSQHLGAITPHICYRCHASMQRQEEVAHPHQIGGHLGFDCTTCHDPHGKVRESSRTDLCLQCHDRNSPSMAWHSSSHFRAGVACTDCHNPHPDQNLQRIVNISHTNVARPPRLPMSVDDPNVCYKCHADIYAKNAMPSHHPIKEGKLICGDCHDPHGQTQNNLTEPTVNMVCYKCHAEKQGPFVYEHPPVTENCDYCHEPHGTVANNLLRQPATFLCLRCHTGHRTMPGHPGGAPLADVGTTPGLQRAFYTDCTQCHAQVHGSDLPSPHLQQALVR